MNWSKLITKHKFFEIQIDKFDTDPWQWFCFNCEWERKGDHCGFEISIDIWNFIFRVCIRDTRHWNDDEDRFMTEDDYNKPKFTRSVIEGESSSSCSRCKTF